MPCKDKFTGRVTRKVPAKTRMFKTSKIQRPDAALDLIKLALLGLALLGATLILMHMAIGR